MFECGTLHIPIVLKSTTITLKNECYFSVYNII